ncbi:MAG: DNA recombination protein RmuC [Chloroflexi bacterium]|nr:DNA recombination protein RmuC [Chloroflexota bacterium]
MDDLFALLANLDGLSLFIGLAAGLAFGVGFVFLTRLNLSKTFKQALDEQQSSFKGVSDEMKSSFGNLSSEALQQSQQSFLNLANDKFANQTERHSTELDSKKELIDTQLQQISESMSNTLKTVPTELDKNQKNVSETIEKSAKSLEKSNMVHLTQLQERSDTQTKEHIAKLDEKELLINRRLSEMDEKLGKVQMLINEFEKARESKLGALDDQLKNLTHTTSSLQKALADNQARGQWGERIAEDILQLMGMVEGVNYIKQSAIEAGTRPDFTFPLPNQLSLHMDCKFPIDNYMKYIEAENDKERTEYSDNFLRNIEKHVTDITKRDYINPQTVDCVLIFIPNEQIYRFINERGASVIDTALRHKVILCSPITLYVVLAVIRQAAMNFTIEQRSREIVAVVNEVRNQWGEYTKEMTTLGNHISRANNKFEELLGVRTRELDRRFNNIDGLLENTDLQLESTTSQAQLPEETA